MWPTTSRGTASIGPCSGPRWTPSWPTGPATVGRLGEGIFVGPIPLAVGIDADLVIVLGLVEGGLPGGLGDDPLLSDRSRRTLDGALDDRGRAT